MPIGICVKCMKPTPDSFHDFKQICSCKTKQQWISYYKKNNWMLRLDKKVYNFTK